MPLTPEEKQGYLHDLAEGLRIKAKRERNPGLEREADQVERGDSGAVGKHADADATRALEMTSNHSPNPRGGLLGRHAARAKAVIADTQRNSGR